MQTYSEIQTAKRNAAHLAAWVNRQPIPSRQPCVIYRNQAARYNRKPVSSANLTDSAIYALECRGWIVQTIPAVSSKAVQA